jgi:hypothetical protein
VFTVGGFHWMTYLLRGQRAPADAAGDGSASCLLGAYHGLVFLVGARLTRALRDRRRDHPRGPWPMALCLPLGFVVVEVVRRRRSRSAWRSGRSISRRCATSRPSPAPSAWSRS